MFDTYATVIVTATLLLAAVTSCRIAYFLGSNQWKLSKYEAPLFFTCACSAFATAVLSGFISYALIQTGGLLYGVLGVVLIVPFVGLAWVVVVGANKSVERILTGLLKKV